MERRDLLHMFTPGANLSPFDVNMAYDAGWDAAIGYTGLDGDQVSGLVQDAIFSRGPKGARHTGLFIGGRDIGLADDMLTTAREAMVPPFEVSVMADPSGAFTTAAALVARVDAALVDQGGLTGRRVVVFGGTGPVGAASAVLAARAGANTVVVAHNGVEYAQQVATDCGQRWNVALDAADGGSDEAKCRLLAEADVVLATAKAGIRVLSAAHLEAAGRLAVAADINAVPPSGIEGVEVTASGTPLAAAGADTVAFGALAIGELKSRTQLALLQEMRGADEPRYLDLRDAYEWARNHAV